MIAVDDFDRSHKLIIYGLAGPDRLIRYIGLSSSGLRRPRTHFINTNKNYKKIKNPYLYNWINKIKRETGYNPSIFILDYGFSTPEQLGAAEKFWIQKLRMAGIDLTNITDGGEGATNIGQKREKSSKKPKKGIKVHTKESINRILESRKWYKNHSDETKIKIREALKSRVWREEELQRLRTVFIGKSHTDETKKKVGEASRLRWQDLAFREKNLQARRDAAARRKMENIIKG